jgi:transposase
LNREWIFIGEMHLALECKSNEETLLGLNLDVKKLHVISALSSESGIKSKFVITDPHQATEVAHYTEFLSSIAGSIKKDCIIILPESVQVRLGKELTEAIQSLSSKQRCYYFAPPYSIFLNPIEQVYAYIKQQLSTITLTTENIQSEIETRLGSINAAQTKASIDHCHRLFKLVLGGKPVKGVILDSLDLSRYEPSSK